MSNKSVFDFVAPIAKILCLTRVKVQISFISSLGLFIICIRLSLFRVQSDFGQGRTVSAISSKKLSFVLKLRVTHSNRIVALEDITQAFE